MKVGIRSLFRSTTLFLAGAAVAALAVSFFSRTALLSTLGSAGIGGYPGGLLAHACVPTSATDDIIFISCGGIY